VGRPYEVPTAGVPHPGLCVPDKRHYRSRIRGLGSSIVRSHAPGISDLDALALVGQLNLGTGLFGKANNAPFESKYCQWVPEAVLDHLRPSYVILVGLASRLRGIGGTMFDPERKLDINWNRSDLEFPFDAWGSTHYRFRVWHRKRSDGRDITVVLWPQHPSRAPMTNDELWNESGCEFLRRIREKT
jgi:hypothetical protein